MKGKVLTEHENMQVCLEILSIDISIRKEKWTFFKVKQDLLDAEVDCEDTTSQSSVNSLQISSKYQISKFDPSTSIRSRKISDLAGTSATFTDSVLS